jgi:hypothetical protein
MKVPTEAELIEMENRAEAIDTGVAAIGQRIKFLDDHNFNGAPSWLHRDQERLERVAEDFRLLIALARDPSQLFPIPDDDALDRAMDEAVNAMDPPRTSVPEPSPSVRPKQKPIKNIPPWRGHI